ncbi:ash family protein [Histophilus somni]|uniref:ash family protein n=1 Tax=Histophilus somni TaxID=731 RepID=UPI00201FA0AE|nr:ash family protein [Histophilus somni]
MLNMNKNTVLQLFAEIVYASGVVAKSTTGRRKLNDLLMANDSTPLNNRAFFVRSLRTPNENALSVLLSMVGRIGQSLRLAVFPLVAVSYPDTLYRQAVGSKAVDMKNLLMGLSQMLYKFMLLGKNRLKIAIRAKSIQQARQQLNLTQHQAVFVARINTKGGLYV